MQLTSKVFVEASKVGLENEAADPMDGGQRLWPFPGLVGKLGRSREVALAHSQVPTHEKEFEAILGKRCCPVAKENQLTVAVSLIGGVTSPGC